jgi:hypothetical protein
MVSGEIADVPPRAAADTTQEGPTLPSTPLHGALVICDDAAVAATRKTVPDDDEPTGAADATSRVHRHRPRRRGRFARPCALMGVLLIVVMAAILLW